jgi:hypothetical protein
VITPGLLRRALWRSAQPRLLAVWWGALVVPGILAAMPVMAFFDRHLGHSTRASALVARLDGSTLLELLRQLSENGSGQAISQGLLAGLLVLLVSAPFAAGAAVAAARTDERLELQRLLAGAAALYGRMLRTFLCGVGLLAVAGAVTAGAFFLAHRANEKAISETLVLRRWLSASVPSVAALFLAHLLTDAARAQFAADPSRRSAVLATWAGLRLFVRRPSRVLAIGATGALAALVPATLLMALRFQLEQKNTAMLAVAWLLAQGAQIAVGLGRNARLFGLAELARADAAFRLRPPEPAPARSRPQVAPEAVSGVSETLGAGEAAPLSKGQGPAI